MDVKSTVRRYLAQEGFAGDGRADDDTPLEELPGIDRVDLVALVDFLEDEFAIAIEDEEIRRANLGSVRRIARFVRRKRGLRDRPGPPERDRTPGIVLDDQTS